MKATKIEEQDGRITITVEQKFLWWKRELQFRSEKKQVVPGYWTWNRLPDMTLVPDGMSFQLDSWARNR